MIDLDGSVGGGQLVRTALTLSALRGEPFRMEQVRGNRPNPGLKRQHLACVNAVAALTDADVEGATVGSETLRFEPGTGPSETAGPDEVAVDVGTAGSVTLVADTLLPLATRVAGPVRADLSGGTDVRWSPSADYLRRVKLPLLRAFGVDADVGVERRGFYPAGGGELHLRLRPSSPAPIELGSRGGDVPGTDASGSDPDTLSSDLDAPGSALDARASVHVAAANVVDGEEAADRVADAAVAELDDRGIEGDAAVRTASVDADSPGVVLTVAVGDAPTTGDSAAWTPPQAGFVAYGDADTPASSPSETVATAAERWMETDAPVDAHLADQLVVWLALVGGRVPIPQVTDHVRTNVDLVSAFGYDVSIEERVGGMQTLVSPATR